MPTAEHVLSSSPPSARPPIPSATREDFDQALTQSRIIVDILGHLAGATMGYDAPTPSQSLYAWLVEELEARLERIEVADMAMQRVRA